MQMIIASIYSSIYNWRNKTHQLQYVVIAKYPRATFTIDNIDCIEMVPRAAQMLADKVDGKHPYELTESDIYY